MRRAAAWAGGIGIAAGFQVTPWLGETYTALAWAGVFVVACFGLCMWGRRPWRDC